MGGDLRQVGGDFLAKALDPEGPPPAQKTLHTFPAAGPSSSTPAHNHNNDNWYMRGHQICKGQRTENRVRSHRSIAEEDW